MRSLFVTLPARACALALVLLITGACDESARKEPDLSVATATSASSRHWTTATWDTVWTVGGELEDSLVMLPRLLRVAAGGPIIFDDGSNAVRAFRRDGTFRWVFGRTGSGPQEFRGVRDVATHPDGSLALVDPPNNRITVLNGSGQFVRSIPLDAVGHVETILYLPRTRGYIAQTMDPQQPLVHLDSTGRVMKRLEFPQELAELNPMARQGLLAGSGETWTFAFTMGPAWLRYDNTRFEAIEPYIETLRFPEVISSRDGEFVTTKLADYHPCSACSITAVDGELQVLFGGHTGNRKALIDRYDLRSGDYLGSLLLPGPAYAIAGDGDMLFLLSADPIPRLVALRKAPDKNAERRRQ